MPEYFVSWEIDIDDAATPLEAARKALAFVQDPSSHAHVFDVYLGDGDGEKVRVDLDADDLCECGRTRDECATADDPEAEHGER